MPFLTLSHLTTYTYRQPVSFGEHRIMVRPRESYDQHLIDAQLKIDPKPSDLRWLQDVFGNSVAIATFDKRAKQLMFDSKIRLRHEPAELQTVHIEEYARLYPFTYNSEEMPDLLRSIERQHLDPLRQIDAWARRFLSRTGHTDTLAMLSEMTAAIKREFTYVSRHEKGTQTPIETLTRKSGTCRDYAMLMIEAVRALGFAARFVSGYLYNPSRREE
ncbi:MAG: transglutaminase family protein, partial [Sphingobacteriales bacterium]